MLLDIVTYPDPLLKKQSQPVESVNAEVRQLIDNMFETMYAAKGVGLAAPQVGLLQQILVIDVGKMENEQSKPDPIALINPVIKSQEGTITWEEGCLSLPDLIIPMTRAAKVVVKALNPDGKKITMLGEQVLSVALQHEADHLHGILLVDRLSRLKQDLYRKKLARHEVMHETIEAPRPKNYQPYIG